MTRLLWIPMVVSLLVPTQLSGQTTEARIEAARRRVSDSGLPVLLLDQKIAEGRAKGIPAQRIAEAVERRANALLQAGNALRPAVQAPSTAELSAGADAVEAGIPVNALRLAIAEARAEDRAVAIAVLTFLHRERGLPVATALARVREAAARGPAALRDLPARAGAGRGATRPNQPGATAGPPAGAGRLRAPGERLPGNRPGDGNRPQDQGAARP
jgi:hypothetical protein